MTGRFFDAVSSFLRKNSSGTDDVECPSTVGTLFSDNNNNNLDRQNSFGNRNISNNNNNNDAIDVGPNARIWGVGSSSITGGRPKQEDNFVVAPDAGLIGVFDGHMGPASSSFCSKNVVNEHRQSRQPGQENPFLYDDADNLETLKQQHRRELSATFKQLDLNFRKQHPNALDGTTACVLFCEDMSRTRKQLTLPSQILLSIANTGDSRAIVIKLGKISNEQGGGAGGGAGGDELNAQIILRTKDHKPTEESEFNRIVKAGGWVTANRRLGGILLTSRSIGSPVLKDSESSEARIKNLEELDRDLMQHVAPNPRFYKDIAKGLICDPDVEQVMIEPDDEVAVLIASDGMWDVISCEAAAAILTDSIKRHHNARADTLARIVAEDLVNVAKDRRTADNTTAVVALKLRK